MTVKYWEIREDRRIVALVDFWNIKAGDIGGTIHLNAAVPKQTVPMWVGEGASVGDRASVGNGKFMQFTSVGKKGRTVVLYWHEQQVVVSVGCQTGISFADFVDRVTNATGTTEDSAQMYRDMMLLFEMARDFVTKANQGGVE